MAIIYMTIKEVENFYKQDKKEYILTKKTIINKWKNNIIEIEKLRLKNVKYAENYGYALKNTIKGIHETIKNTKEFQKLIDFITLWYEIKYPDTFFEGTGNIIKDMTIKELLMRVDNNALDLLNCHYNSGGWSATPVIIKNTVISETSIFTDIDVKNSINGLNNDYIISINADPKTGLLNTKYTGLERIIDKKYINKGYITLEELYNELEKNNTDINYTNLKSTILNKKIKEKIRKEILELITIKLLYSKNSRPEYGYERANKFINEINQELNLNISTKRIDEIMNQDYSDVKKLIKKK